MDIGRIAPGYHEGEELSIWHVPVQVFLVPKAKELKIKNIYEDEGVLCIDVEMPQDD